MKCFLLAALAVLICLSTTALSAPTAIYLDDSCVGESCVYDINDIGISLNPAFTSSNDLTVFGDQDLGSMLGKRTEESTSQIENVLAACYEDKTCPPGYKKSGSQRWCVCIYFGGIGRKRHDDVAAGPFIADEVVPRSLDPYLFDPDRYCAARLKGKCPATTTGMWNVKDRGGCYCGTGKPGRNLLEREQAGDLQELDQVGTSEELDTVFNLQWPCAYKTRMCGAGTAVYWNEEEKRCKCTKSHSGVRIPNRDEHGGSLDLAQSTTPDALTNRLLPAHLTFPSGISDSDWTAIELTLVLLDNSIKSQAEFQRLCSGARTPEAYGFKLDIFRKICVPEITVPVSHSTILEVEQKVISAQWIDTVLQQNDNNFQAGCEHAKSAGNIPSTLDQQWILFQLCHRGTPAGV